MESSICKSGGFAISPSPVCGLKQLVIYGFHSLVIVLLLLAGEKIVFSAVVIRDAISKLHFSHESSTVDGEGDRLGRSNLHFMGVSWPCLHGEEL